MGQVIVQVDAFTSEPFAGNPAAVCILPRERDEGWMQRVAREMNLAETAFLVPRSDEDGLSYGLRWFTPTVEVALCGHATLASAHAIFESGKAPAGSPLRFHTKSGVLTALRDGDWIELDFPAEMGEEVEAPAMLMEALDVDAMAVFRNRFDYLVEAPDADAVRSLQPDLMLIKQLGGRGVIVTARSDDGTHDFVSRFFAPAAGVDEDPVTGSAHCFLAPYWAARLGRTRMAGYQASARGGTVYVSLEPPRVKLRGQAVTVLRGELADAAS